MVARQVATVEEAEEEVAHPAALAVEAAGETLRGRPWVPEMAEQHQAGEHSPHGHRPGTVVALVLHPAVSQAEPPAGKLAAAQRTAEATAGELPTAVPAEE